MKSRDLPRGLEHGSELTRGPVQIPRVLVQVLRQLALSENVPLHGALAVLWGALLARASGRERVLVHTPAEPRDPAGRPLTLAIAMGGGSDPTFRELLRRTAPVDSTHAAEGSTGADSRLVETWFELRSASSPPQRAGGADAVDLALILEETPRGLRGTVDDAQRVEVGRAEQLARQLRSALEVVLRAPDVALSELELWQRDAGQHPPGGAARFPQETPVAVPPTPGRSARRLRARGASLAATEADQLATPSLVQRRLWFLHELLDDRSVYNMAIGLRLSGPLDVTLLERCFGELVARHEILRTRLELDAGDLVQVIEPAFAVALDVVDLTGSADAEARVPELARRFARTPFDLGRCPLWRLELLRLGSEHHVLLFAIHHVASDGWSLGILFRELSELYGAALRGARVELPELELQYGDFAEWQRAWLSSEACRSGVEFWRHELAGAPPLLDLPTDRPRPVVASYRGAVVTRRVGRRTFDAACALGRREQATPFMVLLACFQTLLFRYTGEPDVVVGVTSGSRPDASLENLFGCFLNALVLRARVASEISFRELLAEVKRRAWTAFDHKDVPFELVVDALAPRRDRSHAPLFQAMFVYENVPILALAADGATPEIAFGSDALRLRVFAVPTDTTKYDLTLYAWPGEDGLLLQCEYASDLFDAKTVERWLEHFDVLVQSVSRAPDAQLGEIPLCQASDARAFGARLALPEECGVHALFERSVRALPAAIALRGPTVADVSRAELNARANRLARELQARGVGLEDRVGICLERSPGLVVAVLAVWKAGAAYVPLDPSYPRERLAYLIEDSCMRLAISRAELEDRMPFGALPILRLEEGDDFLAHRAASDLDVKVDPDNLAYVLYTSGSTGLPKGVLGLHRTLLNRIGWEPFPAEPGEVCALRTSLNFIDSIWEIVGSLSHGMAAAIVAEDVARDPWRLAETLERFGITRLFLVPTLLKSMLEADLDWSRLQHVRYWLCGGEPLQTELARRFALVAPGAVLLNLYGTTEFWDAAWHDAGRVGPGAHIPIGTPIANVETWVLDRAMNAVPPGVAGELYVSGVGLARGYHARPGLTAERFLPHPHAERAGERIYCTGDRARILSDGSIEVLGRADSQAKIRGHRVELAEVEHALLLDPGIREVVVGVRALAGEQQLVAWIVAQEPQTLEAVRAHARRFLPDYALPAAVLTLERLPMTPSGKIDRKALPAPVEAGSAGDDEVGEGPSTDTERALAELWQGVLGTPVRSVHANFFGLGGDSVQMVRIVAGARRQGLSIHLREFYAEPTVAALARAADAAREQVAAQPAVRPLEASAHWWLDGPGRDLLPGADLRVFGLAATVSLADVERALGDARAAMPELSHALVREGETWTWSEHAVASLTLAQEGVGGIDAARELLARFASSGAKTEPGPALSALRIQAGTECLLALRIAPWRLAGGWSAFVPLFAAHLPPGALLPCSLATQGGAVALEPVRGHSAPVAFPRTVVEACARALRLRVDELLVIAASRALAACEPAEELEVEAAPVSGGGAARLRKRLPEALASAVRAAKAELRVEPSVADAKLARPRLLLRVEDLEAGAPILHAIAPRALQLCALRGEETIALLWNVPPETQPALAAAFESELRALLERRWLAREALGPSDFPDAELDAEELDLVLGRCEERGRDLADLAELLPLTATQLGMLYHRLYEPESSAYFQQLTFDLDGAPDLGALRRASEQVAREFDALRITVEWDGLSEPHQLVWSAIDPQWVLLDLRPLDAAAQRRALEELVGAGRRHGFDVAQAPPHCWIIARRGERTYTFVFSYHHVLLDGWSMALVFSRFFDLYRAYARSETPALRSAPGVREFIRWYRAQDLAEARRHWREKLAGFAMATPVAERSGQRRLQGAPRRLEVEDWDEVEVALGAAASAQMAELARALRVTPSTQLYAAWALALGRRAGARDVLFGATVSGRSPELPDVERRVGLFINTVPVRVEIRAAERLDRWLCALQKELGEQAPFEATPLPVVQQCSEIAAGRPLFHSIVIFENFPIDESLQHANPDGEVSRPQLYERTSYPLTLAAVPARGDSLRLRLIYDRTRIDPTGARTLIDDVARALRSFPTLRERSVAALWPATRAARERGSVARTEQRGLSQPALLPAIEAHARQSPERPALEQDGRALTYGELNARANRIARALEARGVGRGDIVGVRLGRSPDAIVSFLGVLKAGAAYLPLEPTDPIERSAAMLRDARARMLVTTADLDDAGGLELPRLRLDAQSGEIDACSSENAEPRAGAADLAYVIYTSGSSGRPKGVAVERSSLEFYARAALDEYGIAASDRVLQFASLCFDASAEEIYPCLLAGATLVLRRDEMSDSPSVYLEALAAERISVASLPTAFWHEVCRALDQGAQAPGPPLRVLVIGGEMARARAWAQWLENAPDSIRVVNTYGPTETTIVATWCDLGAEPAVEPLPIGRPVPGVRALVVDAEGEEVPAGTPGELWLGGPGVARGYLGHARLTAERFVPDPGAPWGGRLYRTGDIARERADGLLEYLGRADDQVKIRGVRVEPLEVEHVLGEHAGVAECAVVPVGEAAQRRLAAFVVLGVGSSSEDPREELRSFAAARLPRALVPDAIFLTERLPQTARGKVDRAALVRQAEEQTPRGAGTDVPMTVGEELMSALWRDALGVEHVGPNDTFFDLGGNSLSGARLMFAVEHAFGIRVPLKQLFEAGTVTELCRLLEDPTRSPSGKPLQRNLPQLAQLPDEVRPAVSSPGAAPRAVLLTGATGFVGAFLLAELLERTDLRIHALVRAADATAAAVRIEQTLARYRLPRKGLERVVPVVGDLAAERLGLDAATAESLATGIQAIYHAGALIHNAVYDALAPVNVHGTREILRLACAGAPKVLHHVSSMAVVHAASDLTPTREVSESSPLEDWHRLPHGYVQTKWVAERSVREAATRGLATVVYRPGTVGGSSLTGAAALDHTPLRVIQTLLELGALPAAEAGDSIRPIPVDRLARAIVHLASQPESIGRTYHLFDPEPLLLSDLSAWLRSFGYALEQLSRREWVDRVALRGRRNPLFRALAEAILDADALQRDLLRVLVWKNDATLRALEPAGIHPGGVSEVGLHATLRYWTELGALAQRGVNPGGRDR